MSELIRGSGGGKGGGGGRQAVEAPNTLKSKAYAKVIDLICEGEIEGLENGDKSVFLDGVPLLSPSGTKNFEDYTYTVLHGSQDQAALPDFTSVQAEHYVGLEITTDYPITKTVFNPNIDALRITVSVPRLTEQDTSNGDLNGSSVDYSVYLSKDGGTTWHIRVADTIEGKTISKYERSSTIELEDSWKGAYILVKVVRDSPTPDKSTITNAIHFESYGEIIRDKLSYPNSAIIGILIDSEYFNNIPSRAYDVKLLRVKVPQNYDPVERTYNGLWDGTFKIAWTDNPAWCFYDLCTDIRYGLGQHLDPSMLDKWELYRVGKYCDELVPDGVGGVEPRYTCNILFQSREEAITVLRDMVSIFNGILYWSGNSLVATTDRDEDPIAIFTNANVVNGMFKYEGNQLSNKKSSALVSWNNPAEGYQRAIEYVEDANIRALPYVGHNELEVNAVGCTSRGQAHRIGKWALYAENYSGEIVSFAVGNLGTTIYPGAIISIKDAAKSSIRRGGRVIKKLSDNTLQLDSVLEIVPGVGAILHVQTANPVQVARADGTLEDKPYGEIRQVEVTSVSDHVVTVSPEIDVGIDVGAVWVLTQTQVSDEIRYRIIAISENINTGEYSVSAVLHRPDKYAYIEEGLNLPEPIISDITRSPSPVLLESISINETMYIEDGVVYVKVGVDWADVPGAQSYIVYIKRDKNNWERVQNQDSSYFELNKAQTGDYSVRLASVNSLGYKSIFTEYGPKTIYGKTAPPSKVENFRYVLGAAGIEMTWDHIPDLDLKGYEIRQGIEWDSAEVVATLISTNNFSTTESRSAGDYRFFVKAIDTGMRYSEEPTPISFSILALSKVYGFTCAQVGNRLDFSWRKVITTHLAGYEIREGVSWNNSTFVAFVDTNKYSTSYGAAGDRVFFIKAVSTIGTYSDKASATTSAIAEPKDFNKIFTQDERVGTITDGKTLVSTKPFWDGNLVDTEVNAGSVTSKYGSYGGEYIAKVELPRLYTAQNTILYSKETFLQDEVTWDTATFTWDESPATRLWKKEFDDSIGDVEFEIAVDQGPISSDIEMFSYDNTTDGSLGTTANIERNITYTDPSAGRYSNGIYVKSTSDLEYPVTIPSTFSELFWLRPDAGSFIALSLENTSTGDSLVIVYNSKAKQLILRDDAMTEVVADYEIVPGSLVAIGISQDSSKRRLFASNLHGTNMVGAVENILETPQGYNLLKVA